MALRVLFFGMEGIFSRAPLIELVNASINVCAIVVPRPNQSQPANEPIRLIAPPHAPESDVPLLFEPRDLNVIGIGWNSRIDVYETSNLKDPDTIETLVALKPDVICVACFPLLLPSSLISYYPSLNLHPSLLPAYRGPAPLFWIFHDGLEHAGVTLHLMDKGADTGAIVTQEGISLPDGIGYSAAERIVSDRAAQLLVRSLRTLENSVPSGTPQRNISALQAPNPSDRDYVITTEWTARRAFNFIRGIAEWNHPITLTFSGNHRIVHEAIAFNELDKLNAPFIQNGNEWQVRLKRGTLVCTLFEQ